MSSGIIPENEKHGLKVEVKELRRNRALEALKACGGHVGKAAVSLEVAQSTLYRWISDWRKAGLL